MRFLKKVFFSSIGLIASVALAVVFQASNWKEFSYLLGSDRWQSTTGALSNTRLTEVFFKGAGGSQYRLDFQFRFFVHDQELNAWTMPLEGVYYPNKATAEKAVSIATTALTTIKFNPQDPGQICYTCTINISQMIVPFCLLVILLVGCFMLIFKGFRSENDQQHRTRVVSTNNTKA